MSTLTINRQPEYFSNVPLLEDVYHEFKEKNTLKLIESVGEIFARHNCHDKFGLCLVHRHFDMSEEEILVESIKSDKTLSVFVPWMAIPGKNPSPSDMLLWQSYGMEGSEKKFIVPQNWVFTPSGDAVPFEFFATDDETLISIPSPKFLEELGAALKELGVLHIVGLRSIEHLSGNTWETTPDNVRANVVVHGEMPKDMTADKMIKVLWTFDGNGKILEGKANCFICTHCRHCNHCGTCTR